MSDCYCDECTGDEPSTPERMGPITITARKVTVFQVNGKGKRWSSRAAAFRHASRRLVWNACLREHDVGHSELIPDGESCKYCSKEHEDRACDFRGPSGPHEGLDATDFECPDPTHSYRYRLQVRLTRWLRWADAKRAKESGNG